MTDPQLPGKRRSGCPISASLDVIGDRWSLLIVRDLLFPGFRTYKQFLGSGEGIATNILADRLQRLEAAGIITSEPDAADKRRLIYGLTQKGRDLAPVLLELSRWGVKYQECEPTPFLEAYEEDRRGLLARLQDPAAESV
jgi:DNA-binding HxlR family transcriptional regulator